MSPHSLNIVVIGGSYAGLAVAHTFLDNIIHQLSTFEGAPTYRIVLVNPSKNLFWNICAPKALVSPSLIDPNDAFFPIEPALARHPPGTCTFIQGRATAIDTSAKRVTVDLVLSPGGEPSSQVPEASSSAAVAGSGSPPVVRDRSFPWSAGHRNSKFEMLQYHALILATGSSAHSPLFSLNGTQEETLAEFEAFHHKIETAHSILIVGGGPSGVETAGQLAAYYNQCSRWKTFKNKGLRPDSITDPRTLTRAHKSLFTPLKTIKKRKEKRVSANAASTITPQQSRLAWNRKHDSSISEHADATMLTIPALLPPPTARIPKTITLVSGSDSLLPKLTRSLGRKAEKQLKKLGVQIIHNLREVGHRVNANGSTNCILNNDAIIISDLYISATGVYPNTRYLPQEMLDEAGYVKTDPRTLRVQGHSIGERIYAVGDCASYSRNYTLDVYDAIPVLAKNLHNDLLAHEYRLQTVASASAISEPASPVTATEHEANSHYIKAAVMPQDVDLQLYSSHLASPTAPLSRIAEYLPHIYLPRKSTPQQSKPESMKSPTLSFLPKPTTPPTISTSLPYITPPTSPRKLASPGPPISPTNLASATIPTSHTPSALPRRGLLTCEEARRKIAALEDAHYTQVSLDTYLMPITRFGGVGVICDIKVPSLGVYLLKGRKFNLDKAKAAVERGANPYKMPV